MSASVNLASLARLKSYLTISATDQDTNLQSLIAAASEAIEHYCRRAFAQSARTEYHDGRGGWYLRQIIREARA